MKRLATAIIAILVLIGPRLRAAPVRTDAGYALSEDAPAGTHFWCVFPDVASHWVAVLYARQDATQGPAWWRRTHYVYEVLADVDKKRGAPSQLNYQMLTVPAHGGQVCMLVVLRDGIQQPYLGWTKFNPFGWHLFGAEPPLQARIVEIPAHIPSRDIRRYERLMGTLWHFPVP